MDIKEEEKGKKWTYSRVFSSRCGLDRGCLTKVRRSGQRSGGFSSGTHRLYIDSSAHRQQGWERKKKKSGQKMSDTKVKVAVRVRPMNRRGKCVSTAMIFCVHNSHFPVSCSDSCYVIINFLISSPLLLPACVIRARSQPWAASQFWRKSGFFFFISCVFTFHTPALSFTLPTNFLSAEIELNTKCVVDMEDNQTVLHPPPSNGKGESR